MTNAPRSKTAPTPHPGPVADYERLDTMVRRAWVTRWRAPQTSNSYAKQALETAQNANDASFDSLIGSAARVLGWHERWRGHFNAALNYFTTAQEALSGFAPDHVLVETMAGQSVVLYSQGKQDKASELIRKALKLLGKDLAPSTRVDLYIVQATIVSYSGAFDDALALTDEAIELAQTSGSVLELAQAMHIKARILIRQGNFQIALPTALKAVEQATIARNRVVLPYAYEVLAAAQLTADDLTNSTDSALQAVTLGTANDDQRVVCQALEVLGRAERRSGNAARALETQRQGLAIATEIDYPLWQRLFQLQIAEILEECGRFKEALAAQKAYGKLDQEMFRRETETRMAEMHTKFDLQRAHERAELERSRAEELAEARQLAEDALRIDGLTEIANRAGLDQYIEDTELLAGQNSFAYVVVDLDRFKPINDTFGHAAGDAVLIEVASRLARFIRPEDLVARTGGDEFALIVTGTDTLKIAQQLGERLVSVFSKPVEFGGRDLFISASIGIAMSDHTDRDLDRLMSSADQAMYAAKSERRTSYMIFDPQEFGEALNLNTTETIVQAIRNGEIQPWYQPKVDIRSGEVIGFEALARWVKPDGEVLSPGSFLPLIEQHNLETEFTFSIFEAVLQQLSIWAHMGGPTPHIAINMVEDVLASADACKDLSTLLETYSSLASLITFEITEEVFFDRGLAAIQASIRHLSKLGVQFSMDDFGTGYGSFSHLCNLELHELKIDIDFVQGLGKDRSAEVIIEGFIMIARGLGLGVTAEGIETSEQAEFLVKRGCDIGQGYLYSAAVPADLATTFLANPMQRTSHSR